MKFDVSITTTLVILFVVVGLPATALYLSGRKAQNKDRPLTFHEIYPDEHLGV